MVDTTTSGFCRGKLRKKGLGLFWGNKEMTKYEMQTSGGMPLLAIVSGRRGWLKKRICRNRFPCISVIDELEASDFKFGCSCGLPSPIIPLEEKVGVALG